jgi:hypothetical protein
LFRPQQEGQLKRPVLVVVENLPDESGEHRSLDEQHSLAYATGV